MKVITKQRFMAKYGATMGTLNRAICEQRVKKIKRLSRADGSPGENIYSEGELLLAVMTTWKASRDLHLRRAQVWQNMITSAKQKYFADKNREDEKDVDTNCVRQAAAGGQG